MKKFVHGGNIYGGSPPGGKWLDFSANINPAGLPPEILDAVANAIPKIIHYPDPSGAQLRNALSKFYGIANENIVLGNGGAELFYALFHAVRPRRVLIPVPSFSEYERAALSAGAEIDCFYLEEAVCFQPDAEKIAAGLNNADAAILGSPNNPTGIPLTVKDAEKIAAAAEKKDALVIIDESFVEFLDDEEKYTARPLLEKFRNLVIIESMTKLYAIPGLRLGFAFACPQLAAKIDAAKDPWNVNLLAQEAGSVALGLDGYRERSRRIVKTEREFLIEKLKKIRGLKIYPGTVNFILMKTQLMTSAELTEKFRSRGILIRDCANYPGLDGSFVRVAVKTRAENEKLIAELTEIMEDTP